MDKNTLVNQWQERLQEWQGRLQIWWEGLSGDDIAEADRAAGALLGALQQSLQAVPVESREQQLRRLRQVEADYGRRLKGRP
jgi:hypothetical protein